VWGKPESEGPMFCQKYVIKLHSIEERHAGAGDVTGYQLIDSSGSTSMDENASCYSNHQMIHSLNEGLCHFVVSLCCVTLLCHSVVSLCSNAT
jgi:hypothetical protein